MPDTVEDDSEESVGTPSDDLESAVLVDDTKAVKFGWIRGVLVSCAGISCLLPNPGCRRARRPVRSDWGDRDFQWLAESRKAVHSCILWHKICLSVQSVNIAVFCFTGEMHAEYLGCHAVHPSVLDFWSGRLGWVIHTWLHSASDVMQFIFYLVKMMFCMVTIMYGLCVYTEFDWNNNKAVNVVTI